MDYFFLGNALLMFGAFALQFGLLGDDDETAAGGSGGSASNSGEAAYDPALYGVEEFGTTGDDVIDQLGSPLGVAVFLNDGNDIFNGGIQNDYAEGGAGNDELLMRSGDDIAFGGAGDDTIDGGLGKDTILGGEGNDEVTGNKGDDEIHGGAGDDILTGSEGADMIDGGAGNDVLYAFNEADPGRNDDGGDTLTGGEGDDALHLAGGDQGTGGAGADNFLLYDPGDSGTIAHVTDYSPAEDVVGVVYTPTTDPDTGDPVVPVISVAANSENTAGIVTLNGVEIAQIAGGQNLTAGDIALIAEELV